MQAPTTISAATLSQGAAIPWSIARKPAAASAMHSQKRQLRTWVNSQSNPPTISSIGYRVLLQPAGMMTGTAVTGI
jgi:hypothetical protein